MKKYIIAENNINFEDIPKLLTKYSDKTIYIETSREGLRFLENNLEGITVQFEGKQIMHSFCGVYVFENIEMSEIRFRIILVEEKEV